MARKEYPWFPVYAADLLADGRVQGWTLEERGAWLTLLCFNWNDGSIPAANSSIARLLHIDTTEAGRIMSAIGDRFVPVPGAPDRLWSPRLEEERDRAALVSRKRSEAGLEGAKARWQTEKQADGKGMRLPSESHSKGTANGCPAQPQAQPQSHNSSSSLPTRGDRESQRWPLSCALSARLGEAWGHAPLLPRGEQARDRFEADVLRLGLDRAQAVAEQDAEESILRGRIKGYPESLAWSARAMTKATTRPEADPLPAPDPGWLESLGGRRSEAEEQWARVVSRVTGPQSPVWPDKQIEFLKHELGALRERFEAEEI